jgi:hypothetical protein
MSELEEKTFCLSGTSLFGVLGVTTFYCFTTKRKFIWKFKND